MHDNDIISWQELQKRVIRAAYHIVESGVRDSDRLGIMLPNSPEFVITLLACLRIGAIPVPINTRWSAADIEYAMTDSGAVGIVFAAEYADRVVGLPMRSSMRLFVTVGGDGLEDATAFTSWIAKPTPHVATVGRQSDDIADIMYTAGTSGRPKGVIHHHGFHWAGALGRVAFFSFGLNDIGLSLSALFHIGGLAVPMIGLITGGPTVLMGSWNIPDFLRLLETRRITFMHLVTTLLIDVVQSDAVSPIKLADSQVRVTFGGGATASLAQLQRYEEVVGGFVCEGYGRTEASGVAWNPADARRKLGSNGRILNDVAVARIVDAEGLECAPGESGELLVRGDGVFRGYWNMPEESARVLDPEGWLHTGDLCVFDADGFLTFQGREDHMIKTGAENVYPAEVESALFSIAGVRDAVVIGVPDLRLGQKVTALVVANPPHTAKSIDRELRESLAGFKRPRLIALVDAIPRLGSFKVDYAAARAILEKASARP